MQHHFHANEYAVCSPNMLPKRLNIILAQRQHIRAVYTCGGIQLFRHCAPAEHSHILHTKSIRLAQRRCNIHKIEYPQDNALGASHLSIIALSSNIVYVGNIAIPRIIGLLRAQLF